VALSLGLFNWPEANYVVTAIPPFDGFLCLECIRLHNSGAKGGGSLCATNAAIALEMEAMLHQR